MIETVKTGLQWVLGITAILSFILLVFCIVTKQEVNTWQFPMVLALFLDSIFIFAILRRTNGTPEKESHPLGRSPHRH
jgi:hypothetical protein